MVLFGLVVEGVFLGGGVNYDVSYEHASFSSFCNIGQKKSFRDEAAYIVHISMHSAHMYPPSRCCESVPAVVVYVHKLCTNDQEKFVK